jgi:hypothetical protein
MSNGADIDRYVKDPGLLIELCRAVVDRLDAGTDHVATGAMQAQLLEIAKAIERLENMGVDVPDTFRAEKTRLAAALGTKTEASQALKQLTQGFEEVLQGLKVRLGRVSSPAVSQRPSGRRTRAGTSQTPRYEIISFLLDSLTELGGSAHCNEVLVLMERKLQGRFLPGDLEDDDSFGVKWKHNAHWARLKLANDGTLIKDSPRGYWQLKKRLK